MSDIKETVYKIMVASENVSKRKFVAPEPTKEETNATAIMSVRSYNMMKRARDDEDNYLFRKVIEVKNIHGKSFERYTIDPEKVFDAVNNGSIWKVKNVGHVTVNEVIRWLLSLDEYSPEDFVGITK